jgi:hypothetical protein
MAKVDKALQRAVLIFAYHQQRNGVSHANLTRPAYDLLKAALEGHGNRLSEPHELALYGLCGTLTKFAQGVLKGRKVFALSTGLGKTSAVIAWITALHRIGNARVSVAVSASKVEALCSIKRSLLANGVPDSLIGLKHSLGSAASLPSTGDDDRRFMLVTHQRVRGCGMNHQLFTKHRGQPRAVMIYDESLFRSDCIAISERDIRSDLAYVRERLEGSTWEGVLAYLESCRALVVSAVAAAKDKGGEALTATLPPLTELERAGYTELLKGVRMSDNLSELVTLSGQTLRVAVTPQNEGVLWYRVAVPADLENVLVLDASYPIRQLMRLDPTLTPGSDESDMNVKRFDNVTVHQLFAFSGRNSVERSFRETRREKRAVSREVVEVVKRIPLEESVLIFTFKKREVDIRGKLLEDLSAAGVDTEATLPNGKPRISVLTWGDETSLNDYAHCDNVILAGVIHRSLLDIASVVVGQLDDRQADISSTRLLRLLESEIVHSVFQALSRGRCREVDHGEARPMKAWLIYPRLSIRPLLDEVMPGVKWATWEPSAAMGGDGVVLRLALALLGHLQKLPQDIGKLSLIAAKKALAVVPEQARSFSRATALLGDLCTGWTLDGRSLVRVDASFHGFVPEK